MLRKKLIEVALPLDAINAASAREKSIRHGHPSTLHLWWARRPLAAARAVIFAQMVDDPSSRPELYPSEAEQDEERRRLFRLLEELVKWENTTNEEVLEQARRELRKHWRLTCADNAGHPRAAELFDPERLPAFHDPFAGGGALPLEAQRLGLEAYASDLNPVAVLINKAMIEIPPKFAGRPPVNPASGREKSLIEREWKGAQGLAEDVRYYGQWMRDEAEKRIGHLYPPVEITEAMVRERPDLKSYLGRKLTVIAWIWARTVRSPNPACNEVEVPLVSTFMLSTKKGKEAYVEPVIEGCGYRFTVKVGTPKDVDVSKAGTKLSRGANFRCIMTGVPVAGDYIKVEGQNGRLGARLMAVVVEGERERVYLAPTSESEAVAGWATPEWRPEVAISGSTQYLGIKPYGMTHFDQLFTPRQLTALVTFSDLVAETIERVNQDVASTGLANDNRPLRGEDAKATTYAEAVGMYLAFAVDKGVNYWSSICAWHTGAAKLVSTFGRQALPMVWDYTEANPLSNSSGNFLLGIEQAAKMIVLLGTGTNGSASQKDATTQSISVAKVVSTDPPYYDNIPYADLSDFFYVWLRRSLKPVFPCLFATLTVPKSEELVAFAYRHDGKAGAEAFFLNGMTEAMSRVAGHSHLGFPVTIYYAFKQSEAKSNIGISNTGWETFLGAVIRSGFSITGTWPIRTEYTGNLKKNLAALASSIVLVCRRRADNAPVVSRREFVAALKDELPAALSHLQSGNIAPVDLAQAAIGPGMAVYSRYGKVLDAQGQPVSVRDALALINQTLDEALAEQEGDFDADSRWALAWFEQQGFNDGEYGVAETLSKAKNTSVTGLVEAGILASKGGKVRLLKPLELPDDWNPETDTRLPAWEVAHHLIRVLETAGESATAGLVKRLGARAEIARELCYRLYTVCERKQRPSEALWYNSLVQSWPEIERLSRTITAPGQSEMF
ncbi:MAG: DUF1156 domain-containing protein [Gammaproteobacteria bacterium]|nr:DUF1156 domain-containing protein [Gammaproteobacteria bacterium]